MTIANPPPLPQQNSSKYWGPVKPLPFWQIGLRLNLPLQNEGGRALYKCSHLRWNNHRSNSRKHAHGISCMQEHLYEHFCDSEHSGFLNHVSITFIDRMDPTNPLQRENYWKHTLKIFAPYGLNIKENVQLLHCFFVFAGIGIVCVVVAALTLIAYHCELHVLLLALWKLLLLLRCKRLLLC